MFLQSELHKNFLDDLFSHSYFSSTRTIARIFWLCCSNQARLARHTRQVRCPITLLLIRHFILIVTSNCYLDKVWHQWTNDFVSCFLSKKDIQAPNFASCTVLLLILSTRGCIMQNMLHITVVEMMKFILDLSFYIMPSICVMNKTSACLF